MSRKRVKVLAPLQSWDVYAEFLVNKSREARLRDDIDTLTGLKFKHEWQFDPSTLATEDYTTIVITDARQIIEWVNPGFKEMTGYAKNYALGKHPRFLQGEETSLSDKEEIKSTLATLKPVSKKLLNYRKDGTPYLCDIKIIPLFNTDEEVTHFMALEKKARVA